MKENKLNKNKLKILVAVLLVALIVGGFYGTKLIYRAGTEAGYEDFKSKTEEKLTALGSVVREKSEFLTSVSETLTEIPEEADAEDFETYLEKLETLISKTSDSTAKSKLSEFKTSVSEFLDFYNDSNDNEEISEKYNELKIGASKLSSDLNELYNEKVKSAVENLNSQ